MTSELYSFIKIYNPLTKDLFYTKYTETESKESALQDFKILDNIIQFILSDVDSESYTKFVQGLTQENKSYIFNVWSAVEARGLIFQTRDGDIVRLPTSFIKNCTFTLLFSNYPDENDVPKRPRTSKISKTS